MIKTNSKDADYMLKTADAQDRAVHANVCTHMGIH